MSHFQKLSHVCCANLGRNEDLLCLLFEVDFWKQSWPENRNYIFRKYFKVFTFILFWCRRSRHVIRHIFFFKQDQTTRVTECTKFKYSFRIKERFHFSSCLDLSPWLLQYRSHRSQIRFEHKINSQTGRTCSLKLLGNKHLVKLQVWKITLCMGKKK